jgi:hypothetical protein
MQCSILVRKSLSDGVVSIVISIRSLLFLFSLLPMKRFSPLHLITGLIVGSMALPAFAQTTPFRKDPFTDVPAQHANHDAIEYLRQKDILRGYPDGTFRPSKLITRGEFIKLVMNPVLVDGQRLNDCIQKEADAPETDSKIFYLDVRADDWFAKEVCLATVTKIVNGYPDNTFKPNHYISFAEGAKITANVFAYKLDRESGDQWWYMPYIERLAELKAIPTTLRTASQEMTRGEMAEILARLHANDTTKASQTAERFGR